MLNLRLVRIGPYKILFAAEVDAVDHSEASAGGGAPGTAKLVEVKAGNPRWFGAKVFFQMLSSGAEVLVYADKRRGKSGKGFDEVAAVKKMRIDELVGMSFAGSSSSSAGGPGTRAGAGGDDRALVDRRFGGSENLPGAGNFGGKTSSFGKDGHGGKAGFWQKDYGGSYGNKKGGWKGNSSWAGWQEREGPYGTKSTGSSFGAPSGKDNLSHGGFYGKDNKQGYGGFYGKDKPGYGGSYGKGGGKFGDGGKSKGKNDASSNLTIAEAQRNIIACLADIKTQAESHRGPGPCELGFVNENVKLTPCPDGDLLPRPAVVRELFAELLLDEDVVVDSKSRRPGRSSPNREARGGRKVSSSSSLRRGGSAAEEKGNRHDRSPRR